VIAAILVLYSPAYSRRSLAVLQRLLRRVDEEYRLVAVCNHAGLEVAPGPNLSVIQGHNSLGEFGAWDQGLAYLSGQPGCASPRLFVFANDTFCHHRPFGLPEEWIFSRSFRQLAGMQRAIAGELSTFGEPFYLGGQRLDDWVSTYLYAMTPALLDALDWRIAPEDGVLERHVRGGLDEREFFAPELDAALAAHLRGWLFGGRTQRVWRNAAPLSQQNRDYMLRKARAILCEKLLSARCRSLGAGFLDPYACFEGRAMRAARGALGRLAGGAGMKA